VREKEGVKVVTPQAKVETARARMTISRIVLFFIRVYSFELIFHYPIRENKQRVARFFLPTNKKTFLEGKVQGGIS
jgi:hypothetical protein